MILPPSRNRMPFEKGKDKITSIDWPVCEVYPFCLLALSVFTLASRLWQRIGPYCFWECSMLSHVFSRSGKSGLNISLFPPGFFASRSSSTTNAQSRTAPPWWPWFPLPRCDGPPPTRTAVADRSQSRSPRCYSHPTNFWALSTPSQPSRCDDCSHRWDPAFGKQDRNAGVTRSLTITNKIKNKSAFASFLFNCIWPLSQLRKRLNRI